MAAVAADGELQRKIEEYRLRERVYYAGIVEQEAELNRLRRMEADVRHTYGDVSRAALRGALIDPAANMEVVALRNKAREKDRQIRDLRDSLEANKFNQGTPSGQALVRKCKALLQENKELGDQIQEEHVAELLTGLQATRGRNAQLRQRLVESSEFCKELDKENDTLQGTLAKVAARLRESKVEQEALTREKKETKEKRRREKEERKAARAMPGAMPGGMPGMPGMPVPNFPVLDAAVPQMNLQHLAMAAQTSVPAAMVAAEPKEKKDKAEKQEKKRRKLEKQALAQQQAATAGMMAGPAAQDLAL